MSLDPVRILFPVARVHDHEVPVSRDPVNDQIVHCSALLVAHRTVACLPVLHDGIVVGEQPVQVADCIRSLHDHFTHMGYVKQAAGRTYGHMLADHAGLVLYRHLKAAELHHFSPAPQVRLIQGGSLQFHPISSFFFRPAPCPSVSATTKGLTAPRFSRFACEPCHGT